MASLFPKWMNAIPTLGAVFGLCSASTVVGSVWYWATPEFWEVGYMPRQPGAGFNHQIHAGKLGIDCRYCHTRVEVSDEANIPNVEVCIGCHAENRLNSEVEAKVGVKVQFIRDAYAAGTRFLEIESLREEGHDDESEAKLREYELAGKSVVEGGESIEWRRVHKLPDYVRNFPHSAHISAGVSCYSCHGQIAGMPEVYQAKSLSMSWCLNCHRQVAGLNPNHDPNPQNFLVPRDKVTQLKWVEDVWFANKESNKAQAAQMAVGLNPPQDCGKCHY